MSVFVGVVGDSLTAYFRVVAGGDFTYDWLARRGGIAKPQRNECGGR